MLKVALPGANLQRNMGEGLRTQNICLFIPTTSYARYPFSAYVVALFACKGAPLDALYLHLLSYSHIPERKRRFVVNYSSINIATVIIVPSSEGGRNQES